MIYDTKSNTVHYNVWNQEPFKKLLTLIQTFKVEKVVIQCSEEYTVLGTFYNKDFQTFNDYCSNNGIKVKFYSGAYDVPYINANSKVYPHSMEIIGLHTHLLIKHVHHFLNHKIPMLPVTKYFYSMNNIPHLHRCMFIDYMHKHNLQDFGGFTWNVTQKMEYNNYQLPYTFKYWKERTVRGAEEYSYRDPIVLPSNEYFKSAIEIIGESSSDINFITEKTSRAISYGKPFMIIGRKEMHSKLRELGFKLFENIIDYSFDEIEDLEERVEAICIELKRIISKYTPEEIKQHTVNTCNTNKHHLKVLAMNRSSEYEQVIDDFPDIRYYLENMHRQKLYTSPEFLK